MERVFLLDRSGSMDAIKADTIGGFNSFVGSQTDGTMSLYLFDHELKEMYKDVPMEKVELLTDKTFVPRGATALLDAIGHILKTFTTKKTLVILTDGYENSSIKYTHAHIKDLIEMKQKDGWDIVYLGADIRGAKDMGINTSIAFTGDNTPELFQTLSAAMTQASQTGENIIF